MATLADQQKINKFLKALNTLSRKHGVALFPAEGEEVIEVVTDPEDSKGQFIVRGNEEYNTPRLYFWMDGEPRPGNSEEMLADQLKALFDGTLKFKEFSDWFKLREDQLIEDVDEEARAIADILKKPGTAAAKLKELRKDEWWVNGVLTGRYEDAA